MSDNQIDDWPPVHRYAMHVCEDCIDGKGEMCHTPGCVLIRHAVDIPIDRDLIERCGSPPKDVIDYLRAKIPKEPKWPHGRAHRGCEVGIYCSECFPLVADNVAREFLIKLADELESIFVEADQTAKAVAQ